MASYSLASQRIIESCEPFFWEMVSYYEGIIIVRYIKIYSYINKYKYKNTAFIKSFVCVSRTTSNW